MPPRHRSAVPLLAGLVAGVLAGAAVILPTALPAPTAATAPGAQPTGSAAGSDGTGPDGTGPDGTAGSDGSLLGPDRLPDCAAVVASLGPRARIAQRLMIGVDAADPRGTAETVRATQVGGIFLGGNATALLRDRALHAVQAAARIPVAVAVDDEGGRVQRIDELDGPLPSARRMGRELGVDQVRDLGRERGGALAARGVTVNLAPTVDLGGQPAGAVIGDRAFADDPDDVARYAGAFAEGQRDAGLLTVIKHFPGHGRADGDSHEGRVTTPPLDELRASDLRPYATLLGRAEAPGPLGDGRTGVMVGHLDVPGLTDVQGPDAALPTSLTPAVYALLREEYGFDGLVLTDDLGAMKAVTGTFALPDAVLRALVAGADVALWSSGPQGAAAVGPVLDGLERALADGALDAGDNDRAVARVLAAKGACS
jgi:beta-N-acetylhexosaminidase